jgi:hypothetical protein
VLCFGKDRSFLSGIGEVNFQQRGVSDEVLDAFKSVDRFGDLRNYHEFLSILEPGEVLSTQTNAEL